MRTDVFNLTVNNLYNNFTDKNLSKNYELIYDDANEMLIKDFI